MNNNLEFHRGYWSAIAKQNGWYKEPFYVQIWINSEGMITDSVSSTELSRDYVIFDEGDDDV
jgi:hypothetical protein